MRLHTEASRNLQAWRLVRARYAKDAMTGYGSAQAGTRWTSAGMYVVFAAQSQALAQLEMLVHLDRAQAPLDVVAISVDIPDDAIERLDTTALPKNWNATPPPLGLRRIGDAWCGNLRSLALAVPSAIVPSEWNYMIHARHPRAAELTVGKARAIAFDPRLFV